MGYKDLFKIFERMFPEYADHAAEISNYGKNALKIRTANPKREFVFTFNNDREWRFEPIENFKKYSLTK